MTTYTWNDNSHDGDWSDAGNWSPGSGPPGAGDTAKINISSDVFVESVVTVGTLLNSSGDIEPSEGVGDELIVDNTGASVNGATIALEADSSLEIVNGTFKNTGQIDLIGDYGPNVNFLIGNSVTLDGAGEILMTGGVAGNNSISGTGAFSSLDNVDNTIVGSGTIGNSLNFTNGTSGTIETNTTGTPGGTINFVVGQTGFTFVNNGSIIAGNQGSLIFGQDHKVEAFTNNSLIAIEGGGSTTSLVIAGQVTFSGTGQIELVNSGFMSNVITSDGKAAELTTSIPIEGSGTIGDSKLTLNNFSTIGSSGGTLVINTGNNTITNSDNGTIASAYGGVVEIKSPVENRNGNITAALLGVTQILAPVFDGTVDDEFDGIIELGKGGSVNNGVEFTGTGATLRVDTSASQIGGGITGIAATDSIDVAFAPIALGDHAVWQQTSGSGGILSLYDNGNDLASFNLAGQFNSLDFAVSNDGANGALITVQSTPSYAENAGNNDEWIMADGQWGASAGPGSHPSGYNVALTGDWTGDGTDGILWFNPSNGDADEWQLSNTQWSASVDLGTHPANATDGASYQIAGTDGATDFAGNGIDDVLWTSTNSDGTIATDIWELGSDGKWANSVSPGNHPAGYSVAGTGDWTGNGTDGILWFNPSNGDTDEWQLSGGKWAASVDLGTHPANSDGNSYQVAGTGDFFDSGRDGVLWTSVNSDGTVATDIWELDSSGKWMASVSPGNHPGGYQVVGVGDFTGTGTSDILWYNASNGDTDEWLINNGQWAGSIDLGTHPGGFQIAGIGDFNGDGTKDILWHSS